MSVLIAAEMYYIEHHRPFHSHLRMLIAAQLYCTTRVYVRTCMYVYLKMISVCNFEGGPGVETRTNYLEPDFFYIIGA